MYHVRACTLVVSKCIHIGVVSIHQNPCLCLLECHWQQVCRPEHPVLCRPCSVGVSVESMHEYYVDICLGMCVNFRDLKAFDFVGVDSRALRWL